MSETEESELKASIATKLGPWRFPNVSGELFACLGALLNQEWTNPRLASIVATSDGLLLGRDEGDIGFNEMIGWFDAFERNVLAMADMCGNLTFKERRLLEELIERVGYGIESSTGTTADSLVVNSLRGSSN